MRAQSVPTASKPRATGTARSFTAWQPRAQCVCQATASAYQPTHTPLFPSPKRQEVQTPVFVLQIAASEVHSSNSDKVLESIALAAASGATSIILHEGKMDSAALYRAAVTMKRVLRQRAELLIMDRTDVALAVEANGVLLSGQGVPTVVARRMINGSNLLLGRIVSNADAAVTAAAEGADLVVITGPDGGPPTVEALRAAKSKQRSGKAIPVVAGLCRDGPASVAQLASIWQQPEVSGSRVEMDGVLLPLQLLPSAAAALHGTPGADSFMSIEAAARIIRDRLEASGGAGGSASSSLSNGNSSGDAQHRAPTSATDRFSSTGAANGVADESKADSVQCTGSSSAAFSNGGGCNGGSSNGSIHHPHSHHLMTARHSSVISDEKAALQDILGFLDQVVGLPAGEVSLLRDALVRLEEPFLVVVVGEFNSGKSSVINALLGRKWLAEGVLPTTNEITVLKYAAPTGSAADEDAAASGTGYSIERQSDGTYVQHLPEPLLQSLHVVDTPGTNVILERQQRLTEEFVPRADLVLFVISADRPLSDSEVRFLGYIRRWRKKVVFVVNKADLLGGEGEVEQVARFVSDNVRALLNLDEPRVMCVSSRLAQAAKAAAAAAGGAAGAAGQGAAGPGADNQRGGEAECSGRTTVKTEASASGAPGCSAPANTAAASAIDAPPSGTQQQQARASSEGDALSGSRDWADSGFGPFENFVYGFLAGGAGAGSGEAVRLKLQTPLHVADALLGAAGRCLATDLAAAGGEVAALEEATRQLARFRSGMEREAGAQREGLQQVIDGALKRVERVIDRSLTISSLPLLGSLLPGAAPGAQQQLLARDLARTEAEVLGEALQRLREAVSTHAAWVAANCAAQQDHYEEALGQAAREAQRAGVLPYADAAAASSSTSNSGSDPAAPPSESSGPGSSSPMSPPPLLPAAAAAAAASATAAAAPATAAAAPPGSSLAAVRDLDVGVGLSVLEGEMREAVVSTATAVLGAPALSLLASGVIGNTLEDLVMIGLGGLASYMAIVNLPLRRADLKSRIRRAANKWLADLRDTMQAEMEQQVGAAVARIEAQAAPLLAAWSARLDVLRAADSRRQQLEAMLRQLQQRAENIE